MAKLDDLFNEESGKDFGLAITDGLWYGKIIGPLALLPTDFVYVEIPDISPNHKFGPCRWNTSLSPDLGSDCLVVFDNRSEPWVICIW